MREFVTLAPAGLPDAFDAALHGEEPVINVEESKGNIKVSFSFPGFYLSDKTGEVDGRQVLFRIVDISKTGFLSESGRPLLPSFGRYVQIPYGCTYKVTVETGDAIYFDDVLVFPAQQNVLDDPNQENMFEYDEEYYAEKKWLPEKIVEAYGPYEFESYKSILIHVRPIQYNPLERKLKAYGNISINIEVMPAETEEEDAPDYDIDLEAPGNLFLNPKRGIHDRLEVDPPPFPWPRKKKGPELLIIYHSSLKPYAELLEQWKRMIGFRTKSVQVEDIGSTVDEIKSYIRNLRKQLYSRLRYVILFGDVDFIPSEIITGTPFERAPFDYNNVTDYYYSTSRDPDHKTDLVFPWLSIGRIPVRNEADAKVVLSKIISYEANPPGDPEYYRRMSFAAFFQDDDSDGSAEKKYMKTMESIREHMDDLGFEVERVYVTNSSNPISYNDGSPVPADVLNSIVGNTDGTQMLVNAAGEGRLLIAHRDHGVEDGWHRPEFKKDNLDDVQGISPTLYFSVNCLTGKLDRSGAVESFAEKLLSMNGSAPSLVAATRVSHSWLNDDLMKAMFDGLWAGIIPGFPSSTASYPVAGNRIGDLLNYAKSYLPLASSETNWYIKDHFEIYHIVGDPTLRIWKENPRITRIKAFVNGNYLYVVISDCPKGNVVTIWTGDKLLKRIEFSSTQLKISLREIVNPPPVPGLKNMFVCFSAPGHRFIKRYVRWIRNVP